MERKTFPALLPDDISGQLQGKVSPEAEPLSNLGILFLLALALTCGRQASTDHRPLYLALS
jgi:hypothetical protein